MQIPPVTEAAYMQATTTFNGARMETLALRNRVAELAQVEQQYEELKQQYSNIKIVYDNAHDDLKKHIEQLCQENEQLRKRLEPTKLTCGARDSEE